MKKINILLIICLLPFTLLAQTVDIKWGEKYKTKGFGLSEIIGVDGNGYSILFGIDRQKIAKQKVFTYNQEHTVFSEQRVTFPTANGKTLPLKVITTPKSSYLITTSLGNTFELYATLFLDGKFGKTKPIFNHEYTKNKKRGFSGERENIDLRFEFGLSQDKSTVVYASELYKHDRKKEEEIVIAVFNEDMEMQWKKKQILPYNDKEFFVKKVEVDNEGKQVTLVGHTTTDRGRKEYSVFLITEDELKEYKIDFESKYSPQTVSLFFDEASGKLILSGVYTGKTKLKLKPNPNRGLFFLNVDLQDFSGSEIEYYPISKEENDLLKFEHSITEFRKLKNGNYQFLATCKKCEIDSPRFRNQIFIKYNEDVKMDDLVKRCYVRSNILWTIRPDGELVHKEVLYRKAVNSNFDRDYTFVEAGDYAFLFYYTRISKAEERKFKMKSPKLNYLIKVVTLGAEGEMVAENLIKSKFTLEDLNSVVYDGKIIFGGRINQKVIKLKREFIFGEIDMEKLK